MTATVTKVYQRISQLLTAIANCKTSESAASAEWAGKHESDLLGIVRNYMPSGSGFNAGTSLNLGLSTPNRLVFDTSFHHMSESGMYEGWTEHHVVVTASLADEFDLKVTGPNRNSIKEYIAEMFNLALMEKLER